jgi:hypothetical protein
VPLRIGASISSLSILTLFLAGCAGTGAPPSAATTSTMPDSKPLSTREIYWSKRDLRLTYPGGSAAHAVLTYQGPNGYYPSGPSCENGGQVEVAMQRQWGNPSGSMHATYSFKALTSGPDECVFKAILLGVKNPPIASLKLQIMP